MIAIADLGIGNLSSVQSGFRRAESETVVFSRGDAWETLRAQADITGLVLPGVGAFGDTMFQLRQSGLLPVVRGAVREGLSVLGICVGMQMLFAMSEEHGTHVGLGFLPGRVVRFSSEMKVPHMGWNSLSTVLQHPLTAGITRGEYVYFVHSYFAEVTAADDGCVVAAATYGETLVPAIVAKGNVFGTQFHPEKSGDVGERVLRNFVGICTKKGAEMRV